MTVTREQLIARALELDVFNDPHSRTDEQLRDAIAAEEAATAWLEWCDALPTPEAQRAAVHRLAEAFAQRQRGGAL